MSLKIRAKNGYESAPLYLEKDTVENAPVKIGLQEDRIRLTTVFKKATKWYNKEEKETKSFFKFTPYTLETIRSNLNDLIEAKRGSYTGRTGWIRQALSEVFGSIASMNRLIARIDNRIKEEESKNNVPIKEESKNNVPIKKEIKDNLPIFPKFVEVDLVH